MKYDRIKQVFPKKIRFLIRKHFYKKWKYRKSDAYKRLKSKNNKRRILLLGTPEYGNLGDHAIAKAEKDILDSHCMKYDVIEIMQEHLQWDEKAVFSKIKKEDIILYTGGGFLGSLYTDSGGGIVRKVIKNFPNNIILIMPSTVYYEDTPEGERQIEIDRELWQTHKNIKIFTRESNSYNYLIKNKMIDESRIYNSIDMVLSMNGYKGANKRNGVLIILREDKEKVHKLDVKCLAKYVANKNYRCEFGTTRIREDVSIENRENILINKLNEISAYEMLITDRLHAMIFAVLTGTPCLALDNQSGKVSGVYETIQTLEYIKMTSETTILQDFEKMEKMLGKEYVYTPELLCHSYKELFQILDGF